MWAGYFLLFAISPLDYTVRWQTLGLVCSLLLIGNLSFIFGYNLTIRSQMNGQSATVKRTSPEAILKVIVFASLVYFSLMTAKYVALFASTGLDFSLAGFTKLRMELDTQDYVKGGTATGVLASVTSGFPLLLLPYFLLYRKRINIRRQLFVGVLLVAYLGSTFITGGRNGAFFTVLIALVSFGAVSILEPTKAKFLTRRTRLAIGVLGIVLLGMFTKIFIDRAVLTSGSVQEYVTYFSKSHHSNLRPYARAWLSDPQIVEYYFPVLLFHEYIVHSLKEFEIVINEEPESFPYYGAYNFYPFFLFLNKVGLEGISIEQILREIPNPGRYTTLFGGIYLDFGMPGLFAFVALLYFMTGLTLRAFLARGSFINLIWFVYFYIIIFLSPIYSIIGMANYPGLLIAVLSVQVLPLLGSPGNLRYPTPVPGYS